MPVFHKSSGSADSQEQSESHEAAIVFCPILVRLEAEQYPAPHPALRHCTAHRPD